MDMSTLPPAPWFVHPKSGEVCYGDPNDDRENYTVDDPDEYEFRCLARNAFDVMMRRGWGVGLSSQEGPMHGWYVSLPSEMFPVDRAMFPLCNMRASDPFAALVAADAWYREHIEKQQP